MPFLSDDLDVGGFVFGRGGGLLSVDLWPITNPPLVEDTERGKDELAELVELVSLFASPLVGLENRRKVI